MRTAATPGGDPRAFPLTPIDHRFAEMYGKPEVTLTQSEPDSKTSVVLRHSHGSLTAHWFFEPDQARAFAATLIAAAAATEARNAQK